ncbi:MAG: hypothetical protein V7631_655, partial [Massilia sp.]
QNAKFVGLCLTNGSVQASFTFASSDRVPQANLVTKQAHQSLVVLHICERLIGHCRHKPPELIPRIGIVSLCRKRSLTRKTSKNNNMGLLIKNGRQAN